MSYSRPFIECDWSLIEHHAIMDLVKGVYLPLLICFQAREWEDKYVQLQERHNTARAEFDKLKTISSERKQAVSRLQQENQELLLQMEQAREEVASGASEGEVEARVQSAVEAVAVQAAGEAVRLASELEEARQQLHSAGAAAAAETEQLLAQLHLAHQQLEASQAAVEAAHEERSAAQSHMEDVAEQRDALKEAVQDIQVSEGEVRAGHRIKTFTAPLINRITGMVLWVASPICRCRACDSFH